MGAIAFTQFRKHLTEVCDGLADTGEPVTVTRADGRNFVLITAEEWASLQETAHLTSTEANRAHLAESIRQANAGKTRKVSLDDL